MKGIQLRAHCQVAPPDFVENSLVNRNIDTLSIRRLSPNRSQRDRWRV